MECPQCGYLMNEQATACPRCAAAAQALGSPYQPVIAEPRTSGLAIASFVTGLLGCCGITALAGLVLGIISLVQIANERARLKGSAFAIAGISLSILSLLCLVFFGIKAVKVMHTPQGKKSMQVAVTQRIQLGVDRFHHDTGVYPITLVDLTAHNEAPLATTIKRGTYHGPYVLPDYFFGNIGDTDLPANPLAKENDPIVEHHWSYNIKTGHVTPAVQQKSWLPLPDQPTVDD